MVAPDTKIAGIGWIGEMNKSSEKGTKKTLQNQRIVILH